MKRKICLIAMVAFVPVFGSATSMDIAGIQIGSSFAAQKSLVVRANPGFQLKEIQLPNGKTVGVNAVSQRDGRVVDQMVVLQNSSGFVWFVGRAQALDKGDRIQSDTLLSSLKEKYGHYTEFSRGSGGPTWQFDRQSALYQGSSLAAPCNTGIGTGSSIPFGKVPGTAIEVPRTFAPKCGVQISTWVSRDPTDGMVSAFSVQVVDVKSMYDELNAKDVNEELERKKQLEREKAKDNKPKL